MCLNQVYLCLLYQPTEKNIIYYYSMVMFPLEPVSSCPCLRKYFNLMWRDSPNMAMGGHITNHLQLLPLPMCINQCTDKNHVVTFTAIFRKQSLETPFPISGSSSSSDILHRHQVEVHCHPLPWVHQGLLETSWVHQVQCPFVLGVSPDRLVNVNVH